MASGHVSGAQNRERIEWPMTIASLIVGAAFFSLWFWLLPPWLGFRVETASGAQWRWIAAVPSGLGFAVAWRCIWDFGRTGHGTPAPVAPPKKLVVVGFYRYVRNPMYVGFHRGVDWTVDRLWTRELVGYCWRGGGDAGGFRIRAVLRRTDAARNVRRAV